MAKSSNCTLKPNPFITYRDPKTGLWLVLKTTPVVDNLKGVVSEENDFPKLKTEQSF